MRIELALGAIFLLSASAAWAKPEVIPVVNLEFFGGQTRFDGDKASFYGNGSWSLAPVLKFSDKLAIFPSYSGLVQRTVQVQELIGGALLTQSEQDHILDLKAVRRLGDDSPWKGKAHLGYKKELVRETQDEGWGSGLFDYNKYVVGGEVEREGQRVRSFRTSLDYFLLRYPNFRSLASQEFGSEIASGADVLDLNAVDWLTSADIALWEGGYLGVNTLISPRLYTDAFIVDENGAFTSRKRRDMYVWNSTTLYQTFKPIKPDSWNIVNSAGFFASIALNNSNQNDFDANQTSPRFNKNYYSYWEWQAGPRFSVKFRNRLDVGVGYTFIQRHYVDRPVRSQTGLYTSGIVDTENQIYSANASFTLGRGFSFNSSAAYQVAKSNQKYEQTYKYNYDSANFFIGFSYAN